MKLEDIQRQADADAASLLEAKAVYAQKSHQLLEEVAFFVGDFFPDFELKVELKLFSSDAKIINLSASGRSCSLYFNSNGKLAIDLPKMEQTIESQSWQAILCIASFCVELKPESAYVAFFHDKLSVINAETVILNSYRNKNDASAELLKEALAAASRQKCFSLLAARGSLLVAEENTRNLTKTLVWFERFTGTKVYYRVIKREYSQRNNILCFYDDRVSKPKSMKKEEFLEKYGACQTYIETCPHRYNHKIDYDAF